MLVRATAVQRRWWGGLNLDERKLEHAAARLADNIKCCSCWQCGNRRQLDGETLAEQRSDLELAEARQSLVSR